MDERVHLTESAPPEGAEAGPEKVALLLVSADAPVRESLEPLYERITLGGAVIVDGCGDTERRGAALRWCEEHGGEALEHGGDSEAIAWRRFR